MEMVTKPFAVDRLGRRVKQILRKQDPVYGG
jgi:DNA-binding response OmpR family regulator